MQALQTLDPLLESATRNYNLATWNRIKPNQQEIKLNYLERF